MKKYKFSYDKDDDNLFLFNPKSKSKGSIEMGDVVLDFNTHKELVGIQIINASKFIEDFVDVTSSAIKELLADLIECKIDVKFKKNLMILKIYLSGHKIKIAPVISMPSIKETSPALAYV